MFKKTALYALAFSAVAAVAAPAFAADDDDTVFNATQNRLDSVELTLQSRGWNVSNVEDWGTNYRVTVVGDNGQPSTVILDRNTLQPETRVLTQTDVGRNIDPAPAAKAKDWINNPVALVQPE